MRRRFCSDMPTVMKRASPFRVVWIPRGDAKRVPKYRCCFTERNSVLSKVLDPVQEHAVELGRAGIGVVAPVREKKIHSSVSVDIGERHPIRPLRGRGKDRGGHIVPQHLGGGETSQ